MAKRGRPKKITDEEFEELFGAPPIKSAPEDLRAFRDINVSAEVAHGARGVVIPDYEVGKYRPPVEHRFKPGQSGNPLGGKLHDPAIRAIKNMTKAQVAEMGSLLLTGDLDALNEVVARPDTSVLQKMIASVCAKVIYKGDMAALDVLLNRLIGKVKDEIDHNVNRARVLVTLPSNGREAKAG